MEISINYLAVLAAGVVNMVVGYLWYGPLFGKMWKSLMGFTDESMKSMKMKPMTAMAFGFVVSLVMACALSRFVLLAGAINVMGAWQLAFWVWLGFLATTSISGFLWEGKPFSLFVLNAAEQLVAVFLMTLVLVLWM